MQLDLSGKVEYTPTDTETHLDDLLKQKTDSAVNLGKPEIQVQRDDSDVPYLTRVAGYGGNTIKYHRFFTEETKDKLENDAGAEPETEEAVEAICNPPIERFIQYYDNPAMFWDMVILKPDKDYPDGSINLYFEEDGSMIVELDYTGENSLQLRQHLKQRLELDVSVSYPSMPFNKVVNEAIKEQDLGKREVLEIFFDYFSE